MFFYINSTFDWKVIYYIPIDNDLFFIVSFLSFYASVEKKTIVREESKDLVICTAKQSRGKGKKDPLTTFKSNSDYHGKDGGRMVQVRVWVLWMYGPMSQSGHFFKYVS